MGFKSRPTQPRDAAVESWISARGEQAPLMLAVREVILGTDARIGECIKWSCPTFVFEGNLVSINPQAKKFVSLMFHTGGKIPGSFPVLTGDGATCKFVRIEDRSDLRAKQRGLEDVIRAWCDWKTKS